MSGHVRKPLMSFSEESQHIDMLHEIPKGIVVDDVFLGRHPSISKRPIYLAGSSSVKNNSMTLIILSFRTALSFSFILSIPSDLKTTSANTLA